MCEDDVYLGVLSTRWRYTPIWARTPLAGIEGFSAWILLMILVEV